MDNPDATNESPIPNISAEELGGHIVIIRKELREIKTALIGNNLGTPGIIPRLAAVEAQGSAHDRKLLVWGSILSAAGVALVFIKDIIKKS